MKKKTLSLALALVMCLGLCTFPASAAGNSWPIEQVEMGRLGTFVVTSDHSLYTWGVYDSSFWESFGAKGDVYAGLWPNREIKQATKVMDDVQAVAASKFTCALGKYASRPHLPILMILKTDGSLWVWGDNCFGQLGQGQVEALADRSGFSPVKVMDGIKAIDCSGNLCAAITTSGDLYCWGAIVGAPEGSTSPTWKYHTILTPTKMLSNVTAVSVGENHTLALTADGTVYAMGNQTEGLLGNGAVKGEPVNEMVRVMDGCTSVSAGQYWSMALKSDGTVYAWGSNSFNVFGKLNGQVPYYLTPTPILSNVKQIFSGPNNSAYIKTDNSLWITGDNRFGIHGQGRVAYDLWTGPDGYPYMCRFTPVQVDTNVKTAALAGYAMLYVKNDGVMYGTGSSVEGVPKYTYQDIDKPLQVSTDPSDGTAAVCSPTLAGTSRTPYTGSGPTAPPVQSADLAYASTQTVTVDGRAVQFQMYALKDANGNGTNYIKLRDLAYVLNGTQAQFAVGYDGTISLITGQSYTAAGGEMTTPFSGDRSYTGGTQTVKVDGTDTAMTAITLLDDNGGGYNYFKLRDLGRALGFYVGWSAEQGISIETDRPYSE